MLRRKITQYLEEWNSSDPDKAACLIGARQTGKTTSALEFGRNHFSQTILINFITSPQAASIFENDLDPDRILSSITLFSSQSIIDGDTLLILDEIQECPQARTAVKFLVQNRRVRVIETGSMLGIHLEKVLSLPVGFEKYLNVYPLDFEEFLWGGGFGAELTDQIRHSLKDENPLPEFVHQKLKELFLIYMVVGGMPEVCQRYFDTKAFDQVIDLQKNIMRAYEYDIVKYAEVKDKLRIQEMFRSIPVQLNKQNLRFFLNTLAPKARYASYEDSLNWIIRAGIGLPSFNLEAPQIPLELNEKRNIFRLFLLDTGLLCSCYEGVQLPLLQGDVSLNWGSLLENAAAQALVSQDYELFYYNSKKLGEIDFVLNQNQSVHLLEMKSSSGYRKHYALDKISQVSGWKFGTSYVFCSDNVSRSGSVLYLPWYMIAFIREKSAQTQEWPSFNFEGLQSV